MAFLGGDWKEDKDLDDVGPLSHWKEDDEEWHSIMHRKEDEEDDEEFSLFSRYKE